MFFALFFEINSKNLLLNVKFLDKMIKKFFFIVNHKINKKKTINLYFCKKKITQ